MSIITFDRQFETLPKEPRPPPKKMKYYTDADKRGYLSSEVQLRDLKLRLAQEAEGEAEGEVVRISA